MTQTTEIRVRTKIHPDQLEAVKGKVLTEKDLDILLTGPTSIYRPDGRLLARYLPGYFERDHLATFYPGLHALRSQITDNRGMAAGSGRRNIEGQDRTRSAKVPSMVMGAFRPEGGPKQYCRLTAWTGSETEQFAALHPLFREIGDAFAREVPDRFQSQMAFVRRTEEDWVVPGTPFTTITVNNSYPTGVHTDKGDLDEGFSNLTVLRRGDYRGGIFTFPEYRVGVDMQDGDLLLMDAHEWHGNTVMTCNVCDERIGPPSGLKAHDGCLVERASTGDQISESQYPERISIVCYYRTKLAECGSAEVEAQKAVALAEKHGGMNAVEEMALESLG